MSSKPSIAYIDIQVFAHATEDLEKVKTAVRNILPDELAQTILFNKSELSGHHGNPIIILSTRLEEKKFLPKVLEKIGSNLPSLDKEELFSNIKLHLEKGNLFLRVDKQSAIFGEIRFTKNDPIRIKIHFKNKTPQQITEICQGSGLLP